MKTISTQSNEVIGSYRIVLILLYFTKKPWSYIKLQTKNYQYIVSSAALYITHTTSSHHLVCRGEMGKPSRTLYYIYTQSITLYKYIGIVSIFLHICSATSTTKILAVLFLRGLFVNRADARAPLLACTTVQQPLSLTQSTSNCHLWQLQ